jgi:sRNA-binding carbon storage regulator CsrA
MMLVLTRKAGEKLILTDAVTKREIAVITLLECGGGRASVGVEAQPDVLVRRAELKGGPKAKGPDVA